MRKILYSPGYGAGWTSWESDYELRKFMLVYQPIIDYVEKGGSFGEKDHGRCLEIWNYKTGEVDPEKVAKLPDCLNQSRKIWQGPISWWPKRYQNKNSFRSGSN
jgi:hypothetical protein